MSGCSGMAIKGYVRPGLLIEPMRAVNAIAMFPFDNISGHPDASKKIANLLLTELVRTELFTIADIGEVENILRRERIRTTAEMDLEKLRRIGEQLKVEAVIVGADRIAANGDNRSFVPTDVARRTKLVITDVDHMQVAGRLRRIRQGVDVIPVEIDIPYLLCKFHGTHQFRVRQIGEVDETDRFGIPAE